MQLTEALDQTFRHTRGVVAGVRSDQYDDPTPCSEWTVRDLMEHMVGVVAGMGASARSEPPTEFNLADDPAAQFDEIATSTLSAWQADGVMDSTLTSGAGPMPGHVLAGINLFDTATHAWDLATATGQPAGLPDDVAAAALEASKAIISPELRPGRFDAEVDVADDADTTTRLVAFLGRTP